MSTKNLSDLLERLRIPTDFGRYENLDSSTILGLETWRINAVNVLEDIQRIYHSKDDAIFSLEIRRETIMKIAPFLNQDQITSEELSNDISSIDITEPWVTGRSQVIAQGEYNRYVTVYRITTRSNIVLDDRNRIIKVTSLGRNSNTRFERKFEAYLQKESTSSSS